MERSVGRKLFHRDARRVSLTAEGVALKARAERVFDEIESAERELKGACGDPFELRIAAREMITHYLLPPLLAELEKRHPQTRLSLHELEPRLMVDALLKDRVDLGYYYAPLLHEKRLESALLGRMTSHAYASPALLRRLGAPRTTRETLRLPFIAPRAFAEDPSTPSADGFPDQLLSRDIRYRAELLETHRRFAVDGLCAAVLPDGVAEEDVRRGRLARLPGPKLGRELYFFKREGRRLPPAVDAINSGLRRALRSW